MDDCMSAYEAAQEDIYSLVVDFLCEDGQGRPAERGPRWPRPQKSTRAFDHMYRKGYMGTNGGTEWDEKDLLLSIITHLLIPRMSLAPRQFCIRLTRSSHDQVAIQLANDFPCCSRMVMPVVS